MDLTLLAVFGFVIVYGLLVGGSYWFVERDEELADDIWRDEYERTKTIEGSVNRYRSVWYYLSNIWLGFGLLLGLILIVTVWTDASHGIASGSEILAAALCGLIMVAGLGFAAWRRWRNKPPLYADIQSLLRQSRRGQNISRSQNG